MPILRVSRWPSKYISHGHTHPRLGLYFCLLLPALPTSKQQWKPVSLSLPIFCLSNKSLIKKKHGLNSEYTCHAFDFTWWKGNRHWVILSCVILYMQIQESSIGVPMAWQVLFYSKCQYTYIKGNKVELSTMCGVNSGPPVDVCSPVSPLPLPWPLSVRGERQIVTCYTVSVLVVLTGTEQLLYQSVLSW